MGAEVRVRTAEVAATLCLATDLGMGFPFEHGLHGTRLAVRLADRLGADAAVVSDTYYLSLLTYSGCTADAELVAELFEGGLTANFLPRVHGSPREALIGLARAIPEPSAAGPRRFVDIARRLPKAASAGLVHQRAVCEVGEMLAGRLGLGASVRDSFRLLTERWDGKSRLGRARGDELPLALRIAHVARDATLQRMLSGDETARAALRRRAGSAFDPGVVEGLLDGWRGLFEAGTGASIWDEVLEAEPTPRRLLEGVGVGEALAAVGDFADLISPHLVGHSSGVAALAAAAGERCGLGREDVETLRRAGFVHDIGRVAVDARIWETPGPLGVDDWEQVRLHGYHSERVLARASCLSDLADVASRHHERLDGSGYHRGAPAATLSPLARLLAAADAFHAMTEPRPHRAAFSSERAASELAAEVEQGRLDADAVGAVLAAEGHAVPDLTRPGGLTEREAEVVALLARGRQTKQIARALGISAKTADRHIQNAYAKIGVSTRAAAALFAMEHGLVAWGELPMVREARSP